MNRRSFLAALASTPTWLTTAKAQSSTREIVLQYDFVNTTHGWIPGLSDYSLSAAMLDFRAEIRRFPENFNTDLTAYYLSSHNTPDDLFMFIKKELSTRDGLEPNRRYGASIYIGFLSNAPSGGGPGIGGSPGASVYLKAGLTPTEPIAILENGTRVGINLDKGSQAQSGRDVQVVSTFENGQEQQQNQPYVFVERVHHPPQPV
ncbi:MAG TPA: hypothetical protein VE621_21010, partial [Bryobacteraceae bacterium]|nr:hypothetical protein [Bryobacteraceae bacterium]